MDIKNIRQGIHFDMDTKALEKYYPKAGWRKAYDEVKLFLENHGFTHEQGSGYHSVKPMQRTDAMKIIRDMIKQKPWLNKCINVCTIADVPVTFDITHMFDKNANVPMRDEPKKIPTIEEQLKQNPDYQKLPILEQKIIKARLESEARNAERAKEKAIKKSPKKPKKSL